MKKRLLLPVMLLCVRAFSQVPVAPITIPHVTFVNGSGGPCASCTLSTFAAGTTTPLATYTDSSGVSTNTNPIVLDAAGGANIWLSNASYKFILKTSNGTTIWTVDQVKGGGGLGGVCGPAGAIQIANVGINGLTCDSSITINTSNHTLNVGTLPANHVTIGALGTPTSWTFDTTTPDTARASILAGQVASGTIGQLAAYPAAGTTVQGVSAIPNGITATTQSPDDNSAKVATTAYVKTPGAINPTSLQLASGVAMTDNQGTGVKVQHSTGSTTTDNCAKFDSTGNTVDGGLFCGVGTVTQPGRSYGSVYQNANPYPILVTVTGSHGTTGCTETFYVGSVTSGSPSGLAINYATQSATPATSAPASAAITALVPANWFYGATTDFCTQTSWTEAAI